MLTSRSNGARRVTSTPPSRIRPAVGSSKPAIIRSTVVLPEPDGPSSAEELAVGDVEVDAVNGTHVPEGLDQAAEAHGGGHGR